MNFPINWSISELNTQVNPTTCLGDTDCWIQQSVSPKQVVGFTCVFNSEIDQLIGKFIVPPLATWFTSVETTKPRLYTKIGPGPR